jgi:hypothetical protein
MHSAIAKFPSLRFYGGLLKDAACIKELKYGVLTHPGSGSNRQERTSLLFWHVYSETGAEVRQSVRVSGSGGVGSRANHAEAKHAAALAAQIASATSSTSVAVLSWYNSQVAVIKDLLADAGTKKIHVGTISTAQGSEWDYVILSAVRTRSSGKHLGILSDPHVLNVALTRAKFGLVIIGDRHALDRCEDWQALAHHCEHRNLLVFKSPVVKPLGNTDSRLPQEFTQAEKVSLMCRKRCAEDSVEDLPQANPRKLSDADFGKLLQHSGKLAGYGKAKCSGQQPERKCTENVIVAAHKGVLFGAQKKAKSWRKEIQDSSPESRSNSPSRAASVRRSRSRTEIRHSSPESNSNLPSRRASASRSRSKRRRKKGPELSRA